MQKAYLLLFLCIISLSLSACGVAAFGQSTETTRGSGTAGWGIAGWGPHSNSQLYNTDDQLAQEVLKNITDALEGKDSAVLQNLFASDITQSLSDFNAQASASFAFYEGETVSYVCEAIAISGSGKAGSPKEIEATCDVTTTLGAYCIAFKFYAEDAQNPGNVGLHSVYIIRAEDADPEFSYWGGRVWSPGIIVEEAD